MRLALAIALLFAGSVRAGDEPPLRELNADQLDYFLSAAFARYGYEPMKTIGLGQRGVRFRMNDASKESSQAGIYSHFTLSGDFRVEADCTVGSLPTAKTGYGMSFGIAVHTNSPSGSLFIARASHPEWGSCVIVTRELPGMDGKTYEASPHATGDAKVRFGIRRERGTVVVEFTDHAGITKELKRIEKYGNEPITQVRLYADAGGAPGLMDGWFTGLTIQADAILGAARPPEPWWPWTTWVMVVSFVLILAGLIQIVRRKRSARNEE